MSAAVNLTVDGRKVSVPEGATLREACENRAAVTGGAPDIENDIT